ncbi:Unknown protein, partial [Striga hermonthica]
YLVEVKCLDNAHVSGNEFEKLFTNFWKVQNFFKIKVGCYRHRRGWLGFAGDDGFPPVCAGRLLFFLKEHAVVREKERRFERFSGENELLGRDIGERGRVKHCPPEGFVLLPQTPARYQGRPPACYQRSHYDHGTPRSRNDLIHSPINRGAYLLPVVCQTTRSSWVHRVPLSFWPPGGGAARFQRQQQQEPPRLNARECLRQQEQQRAEHNPEEEDEYEQRSQASNIQERARVEKPRIVLSTFTGTNPDAWLNRAVQFFDLNEMPQRDWVRYAAYYLDGEANVWWQWLTCVYRGRQQPICWEDFERDLLTRFGNSDYHNHDEALTRIRQTGSVRDYQKEFERLACRVHGWPESALVGAFVGGHRYDLAAEVRLDRPETMHGAMEVARRREDHLAATQRGRADFCVPEPRRLPTTVGTPSANARPPGTFRPPATEVKRFTEEEMARRREKGLCFRWEEKYTPGHQCKPNFLIEFMDSDDEEPVIEEEGEVEVDVLNDEVEISVHAMAGTKGLRTMKLPAWLKDRRVTVLVDNGSSYNFINATLSHKLKLPTTTIEPFEVRVANGDRLRCSEMYRGVLIKFQGVTVKADLFVLPLVGPDVVLGVQWLKGLRDVTTNYRKGVMKFEAVVEEKQVMVRDLLEEFDQVVEERQREVPDLLEKFDQVLDEPKGLPPHREFDHRMPLVEEGRAVHVHPYRYAHFQKSEIERQVGEMLEFGLIWHSTSPFSSPVLLAKKKDDTWRFCTDYRALNAATCW